ncbi:MULTISPECIES: 2-polyprenyl-3-methyl-6-methoxy-1,4-benzoquinone monooxygenase [unclassified Herbaspirillum]|uniref:2-polyprenyl-3-methyl-6-methoxy-1,4-benzoquinone monooxygenase n=1 Tax=unclassified Herbaspirillum TaxID=2624150 RepID=UPI000E2EEC96|nr:MULTISPECIES: 2-polyprenyl-3-methyl-6-methoxy-1,4-benzoquinone monooxygenase [unclassified Herbaspirillum]RFB69418.1 2-polyprenyl-3-methyl-6-methoxy-1,4-benzoquinone monooxygenase [Herbaspirillum sp. 3R-3a1]TFI07529.1 2-polyprenyl-3-methyl-6-methoxy-1,4-benzoquinone monooxygenase [Herbaspirillum sp. 3R11]TFI12302.1 2-polyprenyl-3-methyl-6-methoxy-1,4-benzoquinone monooxygenase [Herbaspirillum sp. 3R-11]TFI29358.1 2-polyprenyl-3-methyl-6-methoxy-1,4-benzoquinone monooxygenase [Herbaspirillum 
MLFADKLIHDLDKALRVVSGVVASSRPNPAAQISDAAMSDAEKRHSAGLMRVNHVGEVCAQALYDAQGRFSRTQALKQQFAHAGIEEEDHLAWTAERLRELGSHTSLLNPLWYAGSYVLGSIAARLGDARNLGFVAETERQVELHLISHLEELPAQDAKSRAIVDQMRKDEVEHGEAAKALGAAEMPAAIRGAMKMMSKVMTTVAYRV